MDAGHTSTTLTTPRRLPTSSQDSSPRSNQHMPSTPRDVREASSFSTYNGFHGFDDLVDATALDKPPYSDFSGYNDPDDFFYGVNFDDEEPKSDFDGTSLDLNIQSSPAIFTDDTHGVARGDITHDAALQSAPHYSHELARPKLQIPSSLNQVSHGKPVLHETCLQSLSIPHASTEDSRAIPSNTSNIVSTASQALCAISPGAISPSPRLTITPWGAGEERDLHDETEHDTAKHGLYPGRVLDGTKPITLRIKVEDDGLAEFSNKQTTQQNFVPLTGGDAEPARIGVAPDLRHSSSAVEVPNFKDVEHQQIVDEKKRAIEEWRCRTDYCTDEELRGHTHDPSRPIRLTTPGTSRRRAKSMGNIVAGFPPLQPGQLVHGTLHDPSPAFPITSDPQEGQDVQACSDTMSIHENCLEEGEAYFNEYATQISIHDIDFLKLGCLYHDVPSFPSIVDTKSQPETAMAAMKKYNDAADNFSQLSLAATWGTRRCSEPSLADIGSLKHGPFVKRMSFGKDKKDKKPSVNYLNQLTDKVNTMVSRTSVGKAISRGQGEKRARDETPSNGRKDCQTSLVPSSTMTSIRGTRPISPRLNTDVGGEAHQRGLIGMGSISATTPRAGLGLISSIRRVRSRSENVEREPVGLYSLWKEHGGPPVPTLTSPRFGSEEVMPLDQSDVDDDDDDEDELGDDAGLMVADHKPIIPNLVGFREQIRRLNPHTPQYLVDRISHQQVNRYSTLTAHKVKHTQHLSNGNCPSGHLCNPVETTASAYALPNHLAADSLPSHGNLMTIESSDNGFNPKDHFHQGIPAPPTKTFPAEFECALCFKVKASKKPSDWTKHVHEDVQPFTCTFPDCKEPKTFKRKADWVRHEHELHRQLEWWQCQTPGCDHKCYRKDNFLQHLIREHKHPEPKSKTKAAIKNAYGAEKEFWKMVQNCHQKTTNKPQDEPCRFCGKVLGSWKRLMVHLAKHMEHIGLSVLQLVQQREVNASTNLSPLEVLEEAHEPVTPIHMDRNYGMSATSSHPAQITSNMDRGRSMSAATKIVGHDNGRSPCSYTVSQTHTPVHVQTPFGGCPTPQFPDMTYGSLPGSYECSAQPEDGQGFEPISMTQFLQDGMLLDDPVIDMTDIGTLLQETEPANLQASYISPNNTYHSEMMAVKGQGGLAPVVSQRRVSNPSPVSIQDSHSMQHLPFNMKSHLGTSQQTGPFMQDLNGHMVGSAPLTRSSSHNAPYLNTSPNPRHVASIFNQYSTPNADFPSAFAPNPTREY